jgi:hypothetical protein
MCAAVLTRRRSSVGGNKRTASGGLLELNGYQLNADDAGCVITMLSVAAGEMAELLGQSHSECKTLVALERRIAQLVRGNRKVASNPPLARLRSHTEPPCAWAMLRAIDNPSPLPPLLRLREASSR